MSETGQPVSPQSAMQFLAQLLGIVPEWSTSKQQFEPIDQGTIRNHQSMIGSYASMAQDPMMLALMNVIQPSAFDPVVTETPKPEPEAPSLTLLPQYDVKGGMMRPLVDYVKDGTPPDQAARMFVNSDLYPFPFETDEDKAEQIKARTADAEKIFAELGSWQQYEKDYAKWEANPVERVEEESATAKVWREAGLINPFEQFTPQDFYSDYDNGFEKVEKPLEAYEEAMRAYGRAGGHVPEEYRESAADTVGSGSQTLDRSSSGGFGASAGAYGDVEKQESGFTKFLKNDPYVGSYVGPLAERIEEGVEFRNPLDGGMDAAEDVGRAAAWGWDELTKPRSLPTDSEVLDAIGGGYRAVRGLFPEAQTFEEAQAIVAGQQPKPGPGLGEPNYSKLLAEAGGVGRPGPTRASARRGVNAPAQQSSGPMIKGPTPAQVAREQAIQARSNLSDAASDIYKERATANSLTRYYKNHGETPFMRQLAQVFGYNPQRP